MQETHVFAALELCLALRHMLYRSYLIEGS